IPFILRILSGTLVILLHAPLLRTLTGLSTPPLHVFVCGISLVLRSVHESEHIHHGRSLITAQKTGTNGLLDVFGRELIEGEPSPVVRKCTGSIAGGKPFGLIRGWRVALGRQRLISRLLHPIAKVVQSFRNATEILKDLRSELLENAGPHARHGLVQGLGINTGFISNLFRRYIRRGIPADLSSCHKNFSSMLL